MVLLVCTAACISSSTAADDDAAHHEAITLRGTERVNAALWATTDGSFMPKPARRQLIDEVDDSFYYYYDDESESKLPAPVPLVPPPSCSDITKFKDCKGDGDCTWVGTIREGECKNTDDLACSDYYNKPGTCKKAGNGCEWDREQEERQVPR